MSDTVSSSNTYYSDIEAAVKFYDPEKGFGFVEVSDGSADAYLPASAIEAAGFKNLAKGVVLFCEILPGQKNPEVSNVHFVDTVTGKVQFLPGLSRPQTVAPDTWLPSKPPQADRKRSQRVPHARNRRQRS